MAFFLQGWGRVDTSLPNPIYVLQAIEASPPQVPVRIPPRTIGCFRVYNYYADVIATDNDSIEYMLIPGYFDEVRGDLQVGDIIYMNTRASDPDPQETATAIVTNIATSSPYVTIQQFNLGAGEVVTADFDDMAVFYNKIQDVSAQRLLGNPQAIEGAVEEISIGNALELPGDDTLTLSYEVITHASGTITAAEWNDMYNTPIRLTPNANGQTMIAVDRVELRQIYGGAQYTGGGTVIIGYDDEPTGLSEPATSSNISAAVINNIAATSAIARVGFTTTPIFVANAVGVGIWISNDTAVFATGNGNWEYNIWYRIFSV